jgi:hypothetical protein
LRELENEILCLFVAYKRRAKRNKLHEETITLGVACLVEQTITHTLSLSLYQTLNDENALSTQINLYSLEQIPRRTLVRISFWMVCQQSVPKRAIWARVQLNMEMRHETETKNSRASERARERESVHVCVCVYAGPENIVHTCKTDTNHGTRPPTVGSRAP